MDKSINFLMESMGGKNRIPDTSQLDAIVKKDNTIVSAGAGSGKTEVLASRYAYLLLSDEILHVKNILVLTFTKKAAAEIYARIYKKLTLFALHLDPARYPKEVVLAKRALSEFSDARIQTLDSYAGSVVRLACNRYGVRPDFTTGSSSCDRLVKDAALPFVLKHKDESCFDVFARAGKIEQFAREYFANPVLRCTSVATKRGFFSEHFTVQCEQVVAAWNELFDPEREDSIAEVFSSMGRLENLDCRRVQVEDFTNSESYRVLVAACNKNTEGINAVCALKMNKKENKPFAAIREYLSGKKDEIYSLFDFVKHFYAQKRMHELLDEFLDEVNTAKRVSGNLSFKDVNDLALRILMDQTDIRRQQKALIKKIMIDEFQDNNGGNKNFLFLLSENSGEELSAEDKSEKEFFRELEGNISHEKLFFVGDEKQSIYKFRGADVSVFNELKDTLKDTSGRCDSANLKMTNNYRSSPALLSSFNVMFGNNKKPMNEAEIPSIFFCEDKVLPYDALYQSNATKNGETLPQLTSDNVAIHACILCKDKDSDGDHKDDCLPSDETEAYFIAQTIKTIRKEHPKLAFGDFAVLENSRSKRHLLTRYLSKFGIPFTLDQQTKIFSEGIANDFYNFLRLCVYPADSLAFAAFLSSPFAGVSMQGVQNILASCTKKTRGEKYTQVVFAPFTPCKDLSPTDAQKYNRAYDFFLCQRDRVLSQKITTTLDFLWRQCGYYFETLLSADLSLYAEQYDLLYEVARLAEADGKSVAWMVDQLGNIKEGERNSVLEDASEIDFSNVSYPLERAEAVKVMTIHQSKGLEFPYVFVRGIFDKGRNNIDDAFFFDETGFEGQEITGVSLKPREGHNYFFLRQKQDVHLREEAETKRKVYVAVTRAEREVFIVGSVDYSKDLKAFDKSDKVDKKLDSSLSLMHKLLRFYYHDVLYEDNIFSFKNVAVSPCYKEDAPFDFIKLMPVSIDVRRGINSDINTLREKAVERFSSFYEGVPLEQSKDYPSEFTDIEQTPSALERLPPATKIVFPPDAFIQSDRYAALDTLLVNGSSDAGESIISVFGAADFGTLTHAYLEALITTGKSPDTAGYARRFVDKSTARKIDECFTPTQQMALHNIARTMTESFAKTELGQHALLAKGCGRLCKGENKFKLFLDGTIYTGSMDLIFQEENGDLVVIDYKTDAKVEPEVYIEQQKVYRIAAAEIYDLDPACVKTYLYYLRFDKELDISGFTTP